MTICKCLYLISCNSNNCLCCNMMCILSSVQKFGYCTVSPGFTWRVWMGDTVLLLVWIREKNIKWYHTQFRCEQLVVPSSFKRSDEWYIRRYEERERVCDITFHSKSKSLFLATKTRKLIIVNCIEYINMFKNALKYF